MGKFSRVKLPKLDPHSKPSVFRKIITVYLTSYGLAGLLSFSFGLYLLVKLFPNSSKLALYFIPSILLIAAGMIIFISCVIALTMLYRFKSDDQFRKFVNSLCFVIIILFASALLAHINQARLDDNSFFENLRNELDFLVGGSGSDDTDFWKMLQEKKACCGLESYTDWLPVNSRNITVSKTISETILPSCKCTKKGKRKDKLDRCTNISEIINQQSLSLDLELVYNRPCYNVLVEEISWVCTGVRVLAPLLIVTQLGTIFCTVCLMSRLQKSSLIENYKVNYGPQAEDRGPVVCPSETFQVNIISR